ncbi:MAG: adenylyltransferase/cytidyltransferase family protein [Euryarchaeota archaeon]|nr:adenylyltransferase/cytidyltransferase family protein [Euryarchaeota archaeon]
MKVTVAGTFDIIHPGHIYFLKEASEYGDLHVIIARDKNVKKEKGKRPVFNENERKLIIESMKFVKKAYLGALNDFFKITEKIDPDIIFLGPDQNKEWVENEIRKRKLHSKIIQLKVRKNYSSSGTKEILHRVYKRQMRRGEGG